MIIVLKNTRLFSENKRGGEIAEKLFANDTVYELEKLYEELRDKQSKKVDHYNLLRNVGFHKLSDKDHEKRMDKMSGDWNNVNDWKLKRWMDHIALPGINGKYTDDDYDKRVEKVKRAEKLNEIINMNGKAPGSYAKERSILINNHGDFKKHLDSIYKKPVEGQKSVNSNNKKALIAAGVLGAAGLGTALGIKAYKKRKAKKEEGSKNSPKQ